jgi:trimeric autotransporter adhesin
MMNARSSARLATLAIGLGIGAAVASTPGIAAADALDFQISIDGYDLLPLEGNGATATSSFGDIAIAFGAGSYASATGGVGDFAEAIGTHSNASAGALAGSNFDTANFDTAIDIGDGGGPGTGAYAVNGSNDLALVDAANSSAVSGGNPIDPSVPGSNDIAVVLDPLGAGGNLVESGAGFTSSSGNFDLGAILFEDHSVVGATGADFLYDILSPLGTEANTAAATSGGWLADLLALF